MANQKSLEFGKNLLTFLRRLGPIYSITAVILVNCSILFVVVNLMFLPLLKSDFDRQMTGMNTAAQWMKKYDMDTLRSVYPGKSDDEIRGILSQTAANYFVFEPYAMFKMAPQVREYYAVDTAGFRFIGLDQGPWPPSKNNFNVFVFGGSTTLGSGVPDADTIPAFLQWNLRQIARGKPPAVYNFGVGSYYSTQERIRFEQLLLKGFVPDVAIFVDGLNEFHFPDDVPANMDAFDRMYSDLQDASHWPVTLHLRRLIGSLPVVRWVNASRAQPAENESVRAIQEAMNKARQTPDLQLRYQLCQDIRDAVDTVESAYSDVQKINAAIRNYVQNKKIEEAVARRFGVDVYFVWQPIATYKYDRCKNPFASELGQHARSKFGYPMMAALLPSLQLGDNFIWCADIQEDHTEQLYIDQVHYTAFMADLISRCIIDKAKIGRVTS